MIYRPKKIEWLHDEWRKNPNREFQTRRLRGEKEQLWWGDLNDPKQISAGRGLIRVIPEKVVLNCQIATVVSYEPERSKVRIKLQVGRDYAIQPGRGCYGVKIGRQAELILDPEAVMFDVAHRRLRMFVSDIGEERLQDITKDDCLAEGVAYSPDDNPDRPWGHFGKAGGWWGPTLAYMAMWDGLKPKKGHRWADNPTVFAISFELRAL